MSIITSVIIFIFKKINFTFLCLEIINTLHVLDHNMLKHVMKLSFNDFMTCFLCLVLTSAV